LKGTTSAYNESWWGDVFPSTHKLCETAEEKWYGKGEERSCGHYTRFHLVSEGRLEHTWDVLLLFYFMLLEDRKCSLDEHHSRFFITLRVDCLTLKLPRYPFTRGVNSYEINTPVTQFLGGMCHVRQPTLFAAVLWQHIDSICLTDYDGYISDISFYQQRLESIVLSERSVVHYW